MRRDLSQGRCNLDARSSIPDGSNTLTGGIERGIPIRRMEQSALIFIHARILRHLPRIETTDRLDDKVEILRRSLALSVDLDPPLRSLWLPVRPYDLGGRPEFRIHIVFPREGLPVCPNFRALGIFFAPLSIWEEAGLIYVGRYVAPDSRISVQVLVQSNRH